MGEINAAAGNVSLDGTEIAVDGNITVGTENSETPSLIAIGGQATQNVTQGVQSVITANSKVDAQIQIAAQRVLALSGALFAPSGQISLSATILDTGLLVPVADKILLSGVEAWTKLPLKTSDGRVVYYGMDGHVYAEDGQMLDGTTHLYDELDKDVGTVADIDSNGQKKDKGTFYDASTAKLKKIRVSDVDFSYWRGQGWRIINGKAASHTWLVWNPDKKVFYWYDYDHARGQYGPELQAGEVFELAEGTGGGKRIRAEKGVNGEFRFVVVSGRLQGAVMGPVLGGSEGDDASGLKVHFGELRVGNVNVIRRSDGGYDLARANSKTGTTSPLGIDLSVEEHNGEFTIALKQNKDTEFLIDEGGRAVVINRKSQAVLSSFDRVLLGVTDPTGRPVFVDGNGKKWAFNSNANALDSVDHLVQAGSEPNEHGSLEVNADGSLKVFTDGAGRKFAYRIDAAGIKRLMSVQANGEAVDAVSSKAPMQITVNGKTVSVRATDTRKKVLVDATHEQGGEQLFQVLDENNNPTDQWVTADGKVVESTNALARAEQGTFEIQEGAPGTLAKPLALLKNEKGDVVSKVIGLREVDGNEPARSVLVNAKGEYLYPDGRSSIYRVIDVPGFGAQVVDGEAILSVMVDGGVFRRHDFDLKSTTLGAVVTKGTTVYQRSQQGDLVEAGKLVTVDGVGGYALASDRGADATLRGAHDALVVFGGNGELLRRNANGAFEPTGVSRKMDPTFGNLFFDSAGQIVLVGEKGEITGTGIHLKAFGGEKYALDEKGNVYKPIATDTATSGSSFRWLITGWNQTEYRIGSRIVNGTSQDGLITPDGRVVVVVSKADYSGKVSHTNDGAYRFAELSRSDIPGMKAGQWVDEEKRLYQFDANGNAKATDYLVKSTTLGAVVTKGTTVYQRSQQGDLVEAGKLVTVDGVGGYALASDREADATLRGAHDALVVFGGNGELLRRNANGAFEPTGVSRKMDPTFGNLFFDSAGQIVLVGEKGEITGTGIHLKAFGGEKYALDEKGNVYEPIATDTATSSSSFRWLITEWNKTKYRIGSRIVNGTSQDGLITPDGRVVVVVSKVDYSGKASHTNDGSYHFAELSRSDIPGMKAGQWVDGEKRLYQFDAKGNAKATDYLVKSTTLGAVVTSRDVIQKSDGNGGFVATANKIVRLESGESVVVNEKGDEAIDLNTQTESGDRVVNGKYLIKDISSAAKLANGKPVDKPVYLNADGQIVDENGRTITGGVWSPVAGRVVDSTGQPLADARLVTQEGQPVFH
ncbi:hypothetical protein, partial [Pandoraea apista]|uniref:hypothetical protein n=1 Tax=Pandoraea apista TaxID=93218 RepID=UPI0011CF457B